MYIFLPWLLAFWVARIWGGTVPAENLASVTSAVFLEIRQDFTDIPCDTGPSNGMPPICLVTFPPYTPTSSSNLSKTAAAPTGAPTCFQQNQDPDQGIEDQGCLCTLSSVTQTLPILATGVDPSSSCAYTDLAAATGSVNLNPTFGPPVTKSQLCSVCTPTINNGQTCTSIPSCLPATPTSRIQIGTSPVKVGTLTSSALYTSLSSAISKLCVPSTTAKPPPSTTVCDEKAKVTIGSIDYIGEGVLHHDGELVVQIDAGSWNDSGLLENIIQSAAQSFMFSATDKNCKDEQYELALFGKRHWWKEPLYHLPFGLAKRGDHPVPTEPMHGTFCAAGHFVSPQYYPSTWRQALSPSPQAYLSVEINFQTDENAKLICAFVEALTEAVQAIATPELLGAEQIGDEELRKSKFFPQALQICAYCPLQ